VAVLIVWEKLAWNSDEWLTPNKPSIADDRAEIKGPSLLASCASLASHYERFTVLCTQKDARHADLIGPQGLDPVFSTFTRPLREA
jgi:hypothetical protein